ncbi:MAG: peptidylprolyl isomerase [Thiomargarita sp.]|nr:peptidylprolyl isomerase [Thiomargarita sp.]
MKKLTYIIICTLFISIPNLIKAEILDYIVAIVNDDVIVHSALQQEIIRYSEELQSTESAVLPPLHIVKKNALERLIMMSLQLQLAKNTGIHVADIQLNEQLRQIAAHEEMTLQEFRDEIENSGDNYEYVREKIRQQMIIKRLQQRHIRVDLTQHEIDNFLSNQVQQGTENMEYHLWHILIAIPEDASSEEISSKRKKAHKIALKLKKGAAFPELAVSISDSPNVNETRGDLGWRKAEELPTLFNGIVIKMSVGDIYKPLRDSSGFHIIKLIEKRSTEQSIITQTNARHILISTNELVSNFKAENTLKKLKYRIEQGDNFVDLARSYSQDTMSANKGGSVGWVDPGTLVSEFEQVMNDLSINQVSEPFKTRYGWHIVQVLERRQIDNTAQALRNKVAKHIKKRKLDTKFQTWLRQLREEAYIEYRDNK